MCGIAGIVRFRGPPPEMTEIERMTQALAHRGPDGSGILRRGRVALGHRRLAIIDLAAGRQPMSNEDGEVWVTFNGEIYNHDDLRRELRSLGHVFRTRCDTEVLVHGYEEWGAGLAPRLRGMFAFAIADLRSRTVLLARDHVGIKPLYYRVGPDYVAFGSELAALRAVAAPPPRGSLAAVEMFLRFQYIPHPQTIYADTFKLPPASTLTIGLDGRVGAPQRYWDLAFRPATGRSPDDWLAQLEATLHETVCRQLMSDVPFGVFLSGGVDSTLVAARMSRALDRPVTGFSIGFPEDDYSELPYARQAAERCGLDLVTEIVRDDFWDDLPALVQHYGEPFGDSSAIPTWAVARLARRHVPMVLSGDGGDEGFGGYSTYRAWVRPTLTRYLARLRWERTGDAGRALLAAALRRFTARGIGSSADWQRLLLYTNGTTRRRLWRPELTHLCALPAEPFEAAHVGAPRDDALAYAQYMDVHTYLPDCILTKVDVASMYHGLEVRPPLLDVHVLELAATLPRELRLGPDGEGKVALKRCLERDFPPEFVRREKMGFSIPRARWLARGTRGGELLRAALADPCGRLQQWFRPETLQDLLDRHSERHDQTRTLWPLLVLSLWLEQNPDVRFDSDAEPVHAAPVAAAAPALVPA